MRRTRVLPILILAMLIGTITRTAEAQSGAPSLVGTWRFVEISDWDSTGAQMKYYGDTPCGYIIYTATGQVSVHISRCTTPEADPSELAATYAGYFGTYTVNAARGLVTHEVEGGSAAEYIGTPQQRPFQLKGDTLTLGDGRTWRRVLVRVR